MSKTLSAGMLTHVAGHAQSKAWAVSITRSDAQVFRYTSGSVNATISGNLYLAQPGFTVSNITCTLGFNVDTLEMTVLTTDDMTRADFLAGRWDAARVEFNQYNWAAVADGFIPWPFYFIADVTPIQGGFKLELRDGRGLWRQDYTLVTAKTCANRLGDAKCAKVLTSFTHTLTLTSVTSRSTVTASGLTQAADYFSNGILRFDTGLHAGLDLLIRDHNTGGVIVLAVPMSEDAVIGQTGTVIAGCLQRRDEDCATKFSNVLNFRGHPDVPTHEQLVGAGEGNV